MNSPLLYNSFASCLFAEQANTVPLVTPEMQPDLNPGPFLEGTSEFSRPLTLLPRGPLLTRVLRVLRLGFGGLPAVTHDSWSRGSETWKETKPWS